MSLPFAPEAFRGRTVLLTGHTGFKGAWLALWLTQLGAKVVGVALPPEHANGVFRAARVEELVDHREADIRDAEALAGAIGDVAPDLLVHMAAQPLVGLSFEDPVGTFATNVVGTANVLDAARRMEGLRGTVVVTSDKAYENRDWPWGYRESDAVGGADPYSASKGCTELVASSWRHSFPETGPIATARAGNVIGGGDWCRDRLVPDIMRAALAGEAVEIRNPGHVRPWQHVLEPLGGYLRLAAGLLAGEPDLDEGWNFGPDPDSTIDVATLTDLVGGTWASDGKARGGAASAPRFVLARQTASRESATLRLDTAKARSRLDWQPRLSIEEAVRMTCEWYREQAAGTDMRAVTLAQIDAFCGRIRAPVCRLAA